VNDSLAHVFPVCCINFPIFSLLNIPFKIPVINKDKVECNGCISHCRILFIFHVIICISVFLAWSTTSVCRRDDFKTSWKNWMKRSTMFPPQSQNLPTYDREPRAASRNCERSVSGGCRNVVNQTLVDVGVSYFSPASKNNFMTCG
jgi:hypothetical protein